MFHAVHTAGRWLVRHRLLMFCTVFIAATAVVVGLALGERATRAEREAEVAIREEVKPDAPEPNRLRKKLVEQVAAEESERLLDNLVEQYDDIANAESGSMLPPGIGPGNYHYGRAVVPKLARVRRILQVTQGEDRKKLRPRLEKMLTEAVHDCKRAYDEYNEENFRITKNPEKAPIDPPKSKAWERRTTNANVATYLLAEFRCFESLPVMAKVFERESEYFPVSRLFVFYAMHTLALEHPRAGLSKEASAALDAYLVATRDKVPPPVEVLRPGWNAPIDEGDFRVTVLGRKNLTDKMPMVRLREYPVDFGVHEHSWEIPGQKDHGIAREVYTWYDKLNAFINLAYPALASK